MCLAVSVVIPTYNRAHLIGETLLSILAQTVPPAELIVVDDGSTDDTQSVVAGFGDRVTYHRIANGGVCRARNIGASLAKSPWLAFCDSDDLWRPDKLQQQAQLHEENPGLEYSFTNFVHVRDGKWEDRTKFADAPENFFPETAPGSEAFVADEPLYDRLLQFQPIWPSTVMIARHFFEELGGFKEHFRRNPSEDLEFTLRCVQRNGAGVLTEPVVGVRRHDSNVSGDYYLNTLGEIDILEHALIYHQLSDRTRLLVLDQIALRRVDASGAAFRRGDFKKVVALLSEVPGRYLDSKVRAKQWLSRLPQPLAGGARRFLLRKQPTASGSRV